MKGLSEKEIEVISKLEFDRKHYFNRDDIRHHFKRDSQMRHTIHKLLMKERIVSLNKNKYYLIPIKAKKGRWGDDPFIIADEIFNGKDYFIGGWTAANYWRLTDQVPMKIEVYTTKRQGIQKVISTTFIYRRTTLKRIKQAITLKRKGHSFRILKRIESQEWMKSRK